MSRRCWHTVGTGIRRSNRSADPNQVQALSPAASAGEKRRKTPIRVGVAGWDYKDWDGIVYPAPRPKNFDRVLHLARFLDVVEINSSFYGPPRPATAEKWAAGVSRLKNFTFTAKLWKRFTHERTEPWTRDDVQTTKDGLLPLLDARRLSSVVVQFPWSFKNDEGSREWLQDVRNAFEEFPLVIEVRHESWNSPDFFEWLIENRAGFVNIDQPLFSSSIKPSAHATSRLGYVRVHGRNYMDWFRKGAGRDARYNYLYPMGELKQWAARTKEVAQEEDVKEVNVVFNNHYRGQAVVNALQFKKLVDKGSVTAPALLGEHYPAALAEARVRIEASEKSAG